jgi:Transcription factor WhiB
MGRLPNMQISQWFQRSMEDRPWISNAICSEYKHLPWISDIRPTPGEANAMRAVCQECPVARQCARYALNTAGGFYAGVWLPWRTATESSDVALMRRISRTQLRRLAG